MQSIDTKVGFTVQPLSYDYGALVPVMSPQTLHLHHDKHYAGYVENLNRLIENTPLEELPLKYIILKGEGAIFNNAAQILNHELLFSQFAEEPKISPEGCLLEEVTRAFGTLDELKSEMNAAAKTLFGSGWVWLASDSDGRLSIVSSSNAENPITDSLTPILTIDVWEHAYYVDYENRRGDYVERIWDIIDWSVAEQRYEERQ